MLAGGMSKAVSQVIPPDTTESDGRLGEPQDSLRIGSKYSILPIVGYASDWGLYGGGFIQRINYGVNELPFRSNLKADVTFSTKGNIVSKVEYERLKTFGKNIRSRFHIEGNRFNENNYFGIGNLATYSDELFDEGYFFYENREFFFNYRARKSLMYYGATGKFDVFTTATIWRVKTLSRDGETKFGLDQPVGFEPGWVNKLGIGFIADTRNNEFSPVRGYLYEVMFDTGIKPLGSDYSFTTVRGDFRNYIRLFKGVVFAHNIKAERIIGEAPFWALSAIGDETALRGFHQDRFRGDGSVLSMSDLRANLFSLWRNQIGVGGHVFWDTGRVFSDFDTNTFFKDWKHSFGVGAAFSLFSPDLILRADVGFSGETMRLYFGSGYVF